MPEHIVEWLGAYLDGELPANRLLQAEAHLQDCRECRAELGSLRELSRLLGEAPAPQGFPTAGAFVARLAPSLPLRPEPSSRRTALEAIWWLAPLLIVAALVFVQTASRLSGWVWAAGALGLLGEASAWLAPSPSGTAWLTTALGRLGLLPAEAGLGWAKLAEAFGRSALSQIIWQASIALLYLSWLASWWARRKRQTIPVA
jgi:anti-sigma factor RsiW